MNNKGKMFEKKLVKIEEKISVVEDKKDKLQLEYEEAGKVNKIELLLEFQTQIEKVDEELMDLMNEWETLQMEIEKINSAEN